MTNSIALVTGATRGLGLATARHLGRRDGVRVVLGARDAEAGERAARALARELVNSEVVELDVTDPVSVEAAAEQLAERHGRLDILINNAGILPEATEADGDGPADAEMFRRTF